MYGKSDRLKTRLFHLVLQQIEQNDRLGNYGIRNDTVLRAMTLARELGLAAGIRIDPKEPEWPVAFIELPTGQVSFHLPQHELPWDGHTTEEKYARIAEYVVSTEG